MFCRNVDFSSKKKADSSDVSTEEPINSLSETESVEEDIDSIEKYYVGDLIIEKYYNICSNLKVSIYKNLPKHLRRDLKHKTQIYGCFDCIKGDYYYYKKEPYIIIHR